MNPMSQIPFTIYDFFAYLSSGAVLVATIDYLYGYQWLLRDQLTPVLALFLIFLSYLVGHAVAHFSSPILEQFLIGKILKRPSLILMGEKAARILNRIFSGYYKPLPQGTQERIQKQAQGRGFTGSGESLFLHAYGLVTQSEQAQKRLDEFRNLYGFARNMALTLLVSAILLLFGHNDSNTPSVYWWAAIAGSLGLTMLYRYLKFFRQFSYQLFIMYAELERLDKGTT
jgi:hypothetical protein